MHMMMSINSIISMVPFENDSSIKVVLVYALFIGYLLWFSRMKHYLVKFFLKINFLK